VAADYARLRAAHPGRFLLGLGVSHALLIEADGSRRYENPMAVMSAYLDALDGAPEPVRADERALAALGPKMLELARDRSVGAHPYLVDPTHTARARAVLGPGPLLAPEQKVVLDTDPATARATARATLGRFFDLPNYTRNLRRLGYRDDDLSGGGSDRLVDGLFAWGGAASVCERVREHLDAGADHVCIQVLSGDRAGYPIEEWGALAAELRAQGVADQAGAGGG
jgi:probable F420-dependent oxidoreductase